MRSASSCRACMHGMVIHSVRYSTYSFMVMYNQYLSVPGLSAPNDILGWNMRSNTGVRGYSTRTARDPALCSALAEGVRHDEAGVGGERFQLAEAAERDRRLRWAVARHGTRRLSPLVVELGSAA